jgi:DNA-directed RNA polymerase beta' subunit
MLGKRVDFSGRAVITPDVNLNLNEVGVPLRIAVVLFEPFIIHVLLYSELYSRETIEKLFNEYNIDLATFNEPDLGDILTSIVFIADERVFNFDIYPEFDTWVKDKYVFNDEEDDELIFNYNDDKKELYYSEWVDFIGGEKNVFLKNFLKKFKLA